MWDVEQTASTDRLQAGPAVSFQVVDAVVLGFDQAGARRHHRGSSMKQTAR